MVAGGAVVLIRGRAVVTTGYQAVDAGLGVRVVVAGVAESTGCQILAVQAELKGTLLAEGAVEEVVEGGVALYADEEGGVVGEITVVAVLVGAVEAALVGPLAGQARGVGLEVGGKADALIVGGQFVEEVAGAVGADFGDVVLALIALGVGAGVAGVVDCVLEGVLAAGVLATSGGEVEEGVGTGALPGHHVEDVGLAPVEPAPVVFGPGSQHLNPEGGDSIDCFVFKLPLILEPAGRVGYFEGRHSHDEVVNKLDGYLQKPPVHIIKPP